MSKETRKFQRLLTMNHDSTEYLLFWEGVFTSDLSMLEILSSTYKHTQNEQNSKSGCQSYYLVPVSSVALYGSQKCQTF